MSNEQMINEVDYVMSVKIIKKMLESGQISPDEFRKIDMLNRESFKPKLACLMS